MARAALLKHEFWTDSKIVRLSMPARLMFLGMLNHTLCNAGHLAENAEELRYRIFPADEVDAEQLVEELVSCGVLARVSASSSEESFLQVRNYAKHQRAESRWRTRCPACSAVSANSDELARVSASTPSEVIGSEENKDIPALAPRRAVPKPPHPGLARFVEFWDAYPRRKDKQDAEKAWAQVVKAGADPDMVIDAARRYAKSATDPKYTKYPGTWLRKGSWQDSPEPARNGRQPVMDPSRQWMADLS